ncbi:putative dehydrogenase [Saliterribacillus persicus]|uniref:Putative dehydrogenase n=1 Tax=Saliterribacillus persicus TaxID=930114 RepID=A0A368YBI1_9BACI|nr:putative dehydrogenase [Saliterribacillus persicus]
MKLTLNIGFIGTGGFTTHHLNILKKRDDVKIVAFLGTSQEKADRFAEQYADATGYTVLEDMLENETLDAAYLCVPPMAHGAYELKLIEAGIPFLVEKPLGVDMETVKSIEEALNKKKVITSVGYHFRYQDIVEKWKGMQDEAQTGLVIAKWMGGLPGAPWWKNQAQSGGQFNEQTTHLVDMIRYLYGEVATVYAQESSRILAKENADVTVAEAGSFTLTMKSGVVVQVANTCLLPDGVGEVEITAYTDQGIEKWTPSSLSLDRVQEKVEIKVKDNPYEKETDAFLHAIKTGDESKILSSYQDGVKSFEIAVLAWQSLEEKRAIHV